MPLLLCLPSSSAFGLASITRLATTFKTLAVVNPPRANFGPASSTRHDSSSARGRTRSSSSAVSLDSRVGGLPLLRIQPGALTLLYFLPCNPSASQASLFSLRAVNPPPVPTAFSLFFPLQTSRASSSATSRARSSSSALILSSRARRHPPPILP